MSIVLILCLVLPLLVGQLEADCDQPECNLIEDAPQSTAMFVAVVFRHGDRAPAKEEVFVSDPYQSEERYWPEGYGNLVKRGRHREYTLGKFLRNRYSSLMPDTYHFHDINVTSSDISRTISSAMCVLGGLYLPQAYDVDGESDIVAPIIPVHSLNQNNDMWIRFKKYCPKYGYDLDHAREEKYNETLALGMAPVYEYLAKHTGQPIASIRDVNRVHTDLQVQREQGYPTLPWATGPGYPRQQIDYIAALSFSVRAYTHTQKRVAGGPLVTKIVDSMVAKRNRSLTPDYKMLLFSGHDTTIAIILQTLGYEKLNKPDFGSSILFEMHCIQNQYYVKVFYKTSGFSSYMIPLQFSTCHLPTMCTLDEFIAVNEKWRIDEQQWMEECKL